MAGKPPFLSEPCAFVESDPRSKLLRANTQQTAARKVKITFFMVLGRPERARVTVKSGSKVVRPYNEAAGAHASGDGYP